MRWPLTVLVVVCNVAACSDRPSEAPRTDRILSISFPGAPNPPTKNLIRGTNDLANLDPHGSPETMLSEALLHCGLKRLSWTSFATDGGSRLILRDSEKTRSAIKCAAKTFPLDFYVVPERASESDLAALTQK